MELTRRENWKNIALIIKLTINSKRLGACGGGGGECKLITAVDLARGSASIVISESDTVTGRTGGGLIVAIGEVPPVSETGLSMGSKGSVSSRKSSASKKESKSESESGSESELEAEEEAEDLVSIGGNWRGGGKGITNA